MQKEFNIWETNRKKFLTYLEKYSLEQLNTIPKGFKNNLIWNIGHVIVVQQALVYKSSGLTGYVSADLFNLFKPGTIPTGYTTQNDIIELKDLLISIVEKTRIDYSNGIFSNFEKRTISTGFELETIEDAIAFNNYHEGMHMGYLMSIKKFI